MPIVYALRRAETEDGKRVGDALVEIGPDDPGYEYWSKYWEQERELHERLVLQNQ